MEEIVKAFLENIDKLDSSSLLILIMIFREWTHYKETQRKEDRIDRFIDLHKKEIDVSEDTKNAMNAMKDYLFVTKQSDEENDKQWGNR